MVLKLENKKAIVSEVAAIASKSVSLVIAQYSGLKVAELTALRKSARESGVYTRVVRNTLARRAFQGTPFACVQNELVGPLLLAFSQEEPSAAARIIQTFAKQNEKLLVKALSIDGLLLPPESLKELASLPTHKEAVGQLTAVLQAPVVELLRTLAEPPAKLVRTLAAVEDKQKGAA